MRALRGYGIPDAEVDDALQEVFIVAYRRGDELREESTRAWLYGVARRVASDHRRSRGRADRRVRAYAETRAKASDPEASLRRQEALDIVHGFVTTLAEEDQIIFRLHELEGFAGRELSEMTGMNINTVYSRLRRARSAFKDYAHTQLGMKEEVA